MLGRGRRGIHPSIGVIRQLTKEEALYGERGREAPIQRFRDSHHRMARLFASGLRVSQVAELTGYSIARVSTFHSTPSFQELIAEKRKVEDEVARDAISAYNEMILANGLKAERMLGDRLDNEEMDELSVRELISISRDAADRVGLSKRSVQTNVNLDFASLLDRAIERTRATLPRSGDLKLVTTPDQSPPKQIPDRGSFLTTVPHRSGLDGQPKAGYPTTLEGEEKVVKMKRRI